MALYLDNLSDRTCPTPRLRSVAALLNEITKRTEERGLFVQATGQWTTKGRASTAPR